MNNQKSQYEEVCHMNGCEKILDINEHIHIWNNSIDGGDFTDEVTICNNCHDEEYDDLKSKGYSHDEEEDDE